MSTFKFVGDPAQGGIPRGSHVLIVSMPEQNIVFADTVNEAAYVDLDPGKYAYSVVRLTGTRSQDRRLDDVCYRDEFWHEIDEKAWNIMRHMNARTVRTVNTSEGARLVCQVHGCDHSATSQISALLHEVTAHLGISREAFLADPRGAGRKVASKQDAIVTQIAERNKPTIANTIGT